MIFKQLLASSAARLAALTVLAILSGCQTYRPDPLDLASHGEKWRAQSPSGEKVRAFAKRIADARPETAVSFDPDNGLSLGEGEVVALVFNPDLRVARLRAGVPTKEGGS